MLNNRLRENPTKIKIIPEPRKMRYFIANFIADINRKHPTINIVHKKKVNSAKNII